MSNGPALRIDKWLWYARFFKSRSQATRLAQDGRIRIDGRIVSRAHHPVRIGDVLTFPQARCIRVVRIMALGTRRGPPAEARALYEDLSLDESAGAAGAVRGGLARPGSNEGDSWLK